MGVLPVWIPYCFASVLVTTAMPLLQERIKANPYAIAFWNKVFVALLTAPFVAYYGLPASTTFYAATFLTAILWCISDVIYFHAVATVGAAIVTRLIPATIIVTFFLWFFFDHALVEKYLSTPWKSGAIGACVILSAVFAMRLKKCAVSWPAVKMIWFVLFSSCVGAILVKILIDAAPSAQGAFGFVFCQAVMMIVLWKFYFFIRKPVPREIFFAKKTLSAGFFVGVFSSAGVTLRTFAYIYVDHPAYLSVVLLLDSVLIALYNRARGREDKSDMLAGFGMVACALGLVVLKSLP